MEHLDVTNNSEKEEGGGDKNAKDDDIILISDLDEIPNPNSIRNFNPKTRYATFQQNENNQ